MIQIAVLGYGTVGSGVVEVLHANRKLISKRAGDEIQIKYVLDLRDFPGDPIQEKIVHDYEVILQDPEVRIVVEVMGGTEPAYTFVKKALLQGKSVCTSNKELVAEHGVELLEIAREKNINFLFEASCGGGIPIIRPLDSSLTADEIEEITGILNGTTNYILSRMDAEGSEFDCSAERSSGKRLCRAKSRSRYRRVGCLPQDCDFVLHCVWTLCGLSGYSHRRDYTYHFSGYQVCQKLECQYQTFSCQPEDGRKILCESISGYDQQQQSTV